MPNDGIRLKIILIIEVRKLEFTDFDSHSQEIYALSVLPQKHSEKEDLINCIQKFLPIMLRIFSLLLMGCYKNINTGNTSISVIF